eukprot:GABW01001837.1.p1 GENE.GABW01001837.1~~GABW01001837.1.p1  ORF type:complete len:75 (-),score=6.25 GABW01001837.1:81-305(-)
MTISHTRTHLTHPQCDITPQLEEWSNNKLKKTFLTLRHTRSFTTHKRADRKTCTHFMITLIPELIIHSFTPLTV